MHPGSARHLSLLAQRVRAVQPVVAEITGNARLVVPGEPRQPTGDVGPLGKATAPPIVVLRHGMELRQVERQHLGAPFGGGGQGLHLLEQRPRLRVAPDLGGDVGIGWRPCCEHTGFMAMLTVVHQRIDEVVPSGWTV